MAIGATAVWRIRIAGNDANGAGYDAGIASAGTDYSQQDSPQMSVTDAACTTGTTTLTSTTGGFTTAMIGNAVRISAGTHFVTGYYFITARASTNSVTIDRDPTDGTNATGGTAKVGGAAISYSRLLDSTNATGDKVVAGNVVYMRGSGSNAPVSSDYADTTGFITPVAGDSTSGHVRLIGENGRPRFRSNGLILYICSWFWLENLYISTTSNSNGNLGVLNLTTSCFVKNCVVYTNGTNCLGMQISSGTCVLSCEIFAGTSTPSFSANAFGIATSTYWNSVIGCYIHHMPDAGLANNTGDGPAFVGNIVAGCAGAGIKLSTAIGAQSTANLCAGNTVYGNSSDGIKVTNADAVMNWMIYNNIVANNGGYGLNVATGSTAANDSYKRFYDYNNYYNNSSGAYQNVSAGANDLALDPQFTNPSGGDYSIGANLKAKGWPGLFRGSSSTSYQDIGAVQRQEAGGGGGIANIFSSPIVKGAA